MTADVITGTLETSGGHKGRRSVEVVDFTASWDNVKAKRDNERSKNIGWFGLLTKFWKYHEQDENSSQSSGGVNRENNYKVRTMKNSCIVLGL